MINHLSMLKVLAYQPLEILVLFISNKRFYMLLSEILELVKL